MADRLEEMALFPLNTVLFPYAQVQLHVFEPKFRELVEKCLEQDTGFGVVLKKGDNDTYLVGTAVRIVSVDRLEDDKLDVRIHGQRRFRVRRLDEDSRPYPVGLVEPIVELEVDDTPRANALAFRLKECVEQYIRNELRHDDFRVQKINLPNEPTALSFVVANFLRIEDLDKQRLLESTDTLERMAEIVPLIEQQIVDSHTTGPYRVTASMLEEWVTPN